MTGQLPSENERQARLWRRIDAESDAERARLGRSLTREEVDVIYHRCCDREQAEHLALIKRFELEELERSALERAEASASTWLGGWQTLGELGGWLSSPPPPRRWLLQRSSDETGELVGVLGRGLVGMLLAPGGRGKTWALVQLAISVATGRPWLDTFACEEPGNVLLALAEEDTDEVRRRLYYAARGLGLSREETAAANARIIPLGLAGEHVGLVSMDRLGRATPSDVHAHLSERLSDREWALIILDPLSRWAPGVETTNEGATMAVTALEALAKAPGSPTVIAAHHTSKWSRREGNRGDATGARGVTGLTDGVRWAASLTGSTEKDLTFVVTKSNGAPLGEALPLIRDESGVLRPLSRAEDAQRGEQMAARAAMLRETFCAIVVAAPGLGTAAVRAAFKDRGIKARKDAIDAGIRAALEAGEVVDLGNKNRHAYHPGPACPRLPEGCPELPGQPQPDRLPACPAPIGASRAGNRHRGQDGESGPGQAPGNLDVPDQGSNDDGSAPSRRPALVALRPGLKAAKVARVAGAAE